MEDLLQNSLLTLRLLLVYQESKAYQYHYNVQLKGPQFLALGKDLSKDSLLLEPIGGSAPKFSFETHTVTGMFRKQSLSISLQCPAQGSPIPSFR